MTGHAEPLTLRLTLDHRGQRFAIEEPLLEGKPIKVVVGSGRAKLNGRVDLPAQRLPKIKPLNFAKPSLSANPPSIRKKHHLQKIIEAGRYR